MFVFDVEADVIYRAFSLTEAQRLLQSHGKTTSELGQIGNISLPIGLVYDEESKDLILIGEVDATKNVITIDDIAVVMRAVLKHGKPPLVSIDRTTDTDRTNKQAVRFEGGIENTQVGRDLLDADVVLKKMGLGLLSTELWGVRSYAAMSAEEWKTNGREEAICSRFWFVPSEHSQVGEIPGVAVLDEVIHIEVRTELLGGVGKEKTSNIRDVIGDRFAASVAAGLDDVATANPVLRRLDPLFRLSGLMQGVAKWQKHGGESVIPNVTFWQDEFPVKTVETKPEFDLLKSKPFERQSNGSKLTMTVDGGIDMTMLIAEWRDNGSLKAFKQLVLAARPKDKPLTWSVQLDQIPNSSISVPSSEAHKEAENPSMSLRQQIFSPEGLHTGMPSSDLVSRYPTPSQQTFSFTHIGQPTHLTDKVGGVMLSATAKLVGQDESKIDLSSGNFSFIMDGAKAQLAPETFRKFVTALWSLYFSKEDPGISIDPICTPFNAPECKGIDKHLVRYIGRVINTDLGRVMREADYTMKKWAIGTDKPAVPGFKNVDDLMAKMGLRDVGVSRRFWFVPEDMSFKRSGDMLMFDQGDMTLKTEYMMEGSAGKANPGDKVFAKFFTEHYKEIAAKYPIYEELVDYAKMVALAKYLKQNQVPLFWFLMANKDLVLTEDSPGTVDELARGSKNFRGIEIHGGVNMQPSEHYVYDKQAVQALQRATTQREAPFASTGQALSSPDDYDPKIPPPVSTQPVSFNVGEKAYTVTPQHTLTSGKDRRGIRYQTDFAVRGNEGAGLEAVRYFDPRSPEVQGEFGKGWRVLIPYRIHPKTGKTIKFQNALIPEEVTVDNLLSGEQEVLKFSTDRYSVAGYVPDTLKQSQVVGLFLMSDASFRLADKLGNEFWFDQAGLLSDMIFSEDHHVHYEYLDGTLDGIESAPYRLQMGEKGWITFLNADVPREMLVVDITSGKKETFELQERGSTAEYVPEHEPWSRFRIMRLMMDGSFTLIDKRGENFTFDASGHFKTVSASAERPLVKSQKMKNQQVDFTYEYRADSGLRIKQALVSNVGESKPIQTVRYEYDDESRLARIVKPEAENESLSSLEAPKTVSTFH